jgi:hypothetical protein
MPGWLVVVDYKWVCPFCRFTEVGLQPAEVDQGFKRWTVTMDSNKLAASTWKSYGAGAKLVDTWNKQPGRAEAPWSQTKLEYMAVSMANEGTTAPKLDTAWQALSLRSQAHDWSLDRLRCPTWLRP